MAGAVGDSPDGGASGKPTSWQGFFWGGTAGLPFRRPPELDGIEPRGRGLKAG